MKAWRQKNKDKVNEQARRYRARHPETRQKAKAKYRLTNLEKIREEDKLRQRERREQFPEKQAMVSWKAKIKRESKLWEQAGSPRADLCELCDEEGTTVFDHCHVSGLFRGWICDRCNKVLGLVYDSSELLIKMSQYLQRKKHGKTNSQTTSIAA